MTPQEEEELLDNFAANGCDHGFKPAKKCLEHNPFCAEGLLQIYIEKCRKSRLAVDSILSDAVMGPECCSERETLDGIIKTATEELKEVP